MKKLCSLIGTSKYKGCIYRLGDYRSSATSYVQMALLELLPKVGHPIEELVVFATEEARAAHEASLRNEILQKGAAVSLRFVPIVDKVTECTIWEFFRQVYDTIDEKDTIYFDITHGFRSLPLAVLSILHYARELKSIENGKVLYGNFEARTMAIDCNTYVAQIDDLTDLVSFLDWTYGVKTFLSTGDAKMLIQLTEEQGLASQPYADTDVDSFRSRQVAERMQNLTQAMATCRGTTFAYHALRLRSTIEEAMDDPVAYSQPLVNLFHKVAEKMEPFTGDKVMDPSYAVTWCIEHGMIQQAYTLLEEHVTTAFCLMLGVDDNKRKTREVVSSGLNVGMQRKPESEWIYQSLADKKLMERVVELLKEFEAFKGSFSLLKKYRNNINHAEKNAGMIKIGKIYSTIVELTRALEPFFLQVQLVLHSREQTAASKD